MNINKLLDNVFFLLCVRGWMEVGIDGGGFGSADEGGDVVEGGFFEAFDALEFFHQCGGC